MIILIQILLVLTAQHLEALQLIPLRNRVKRNVSYQTNSVAEEQPTIISIDIKSLSFEDAQKKVDEHIMGLALQQAKEAGEKFDEVPIGAIVAQEFEERSSSVLKIAIFNGQNQIETNNDASAHAEMQAMRLAGRSSQNWRLMNSTLYTTLEPCPMCLSAAQAFRIARIVYGAPDLRLGAIETHIEMLKIKHPFHDSMDALGGVRGDEASSMLVNFFRERRKKGKRPKSDTSANDSDEQTSSTSNDDLNPTTGRFRQLIARLRGGETT